MKKFKTIEAAAVAASAEVRALTLKSGYEYGGMILSVPGGYTYTPPITSENTGMVDMTPVIASITGITDMSRSNRKRIVRALHKAGVVSQYHSHPCNADTRGETLAIYFSPGDMHMLGDLNIEKTYMVVSCSGKVYEGNGDLPVIYPEGIFGSAAALGPVIATV